LIATVAGLLFLVGISLITLFVTRTLHDDMHELLTQQQLMNASYVARDIDGKVKLRLDSLARVASNFPLDLIARSADLQHWLEDRRAIHTLFPTGLMIIPVDGSETLAETPRLKTRPKSFVDRDWFVGVKSTLKPFVSKPLIARSTNEPALVIAVPVLDKRNRLMAILAGVTPLETPGFLDLIKGATPGQQGRYQLISPRHKLFVLTPDVTLSAATLPSLGQDPVIDMALQGKTGAHLAKNVAGESELVVIVPVHQAGWLLLARQPSKLAFEPVTHTVQNTILITVLLSIPLIGLLLLAVSWLLNPFAKLARQLRNMAEGTEPMKPVTVLPIEEVADVANSFNRLQARLLQQERRLADMAHHDGLTGLPNRIAINDRLESELLRIRRSGAGLALLFLDLDGFKPVNDQYGHQVGDRLLIEIAHRLQTCVRNVDMVARLGGDEFLILLSDSEVPLEAAKRVSQQCIDALGTPFVIDGLQISVGVSVGISVVLGADSNIVTATQLVSFADVAMYQAKGNGRGCYAIYTPSSSEELN
jgi:diguanylate cyclase (GGDEF)-like protein